MTDDDLVVPTADLVEPDKAILVDVRDEETDLVNMAFNHDDGRTLLIDESAGVSKDVMVDFVDE